MARLCWARCLGDCGGGVSGEHPVSAGLFTSKAVTVSGWGRVERTVGLVLAAARKRVNTDMKGGWPETEEC